MLELWETVEVLIHMCRRRAHTRSTELDNTSNLLFERQWCTVFSDDGFRWIVRRMVYGRLHDDGIHQPILVFLFFLICVYGRPASHEPILVLLFFLVGVYGRPASREPIT